MSINHLEGFIEGFEVFLLRIEKLKKLSIELDLVRNTNDRKRMLDQISKDIERANADIKGLMIEIKRAPKQQEVELLQELNKQRTIVNEIEENLNEKKKKFKYDIMLLDERKIIDDLENINHSNVDDLEIKIKDIGIHLSKEDALAAEIIKNKIVKNFKDGQLSLRSLHGDMPENVPKAQVKSQNERDLDYQQPKPMIIDLDLQKVDPLCKRTGTCLKYFLVHYCRDKLSCFLMILLFAAIAFVVVGFLLKDKNSKSTL